MSESDARCRSCSEALSEDEPEGSVVCGRCRRGVERQHRNGWQPGMHWEDEYREGLHVSSGAPVPWDRNTVALIRITRDGQVTAAHSFNAKYRMLSKADPEDLLLVAWPGQRRQEVFAVDNRQAALKACTPWTETAAYRKRQRAR